jgi:hypothetical protein
VGFDGSEHGTISSHVSLFLHPKPATSPHSAYFIAGYSHCPTGTVRVGASPPYVPGTKSTTDVVAAAKAPPSLSPVTSIRHTMYVCFAFCPLHYNIPRIDIYGRDLISKAVYLCISIFHSCRFLSKMDFILLLHNASCSAVLPSRKDFYHFPSCTCSLGDIRSHKVQRKKRKKKKSTW